MIATDEEQPGQYADVLIRYELLAATLNTVLRVEVPGVPETQGSKTPVPITNRAGRLVKINLREDNPRLKPWRDSVVVHARRAKATAHLDPIAGPVYVRALFTIPRPASHLRTGRFAGQLKDWAPRWHAIQERDTDKMQRAVGDALKQAGVLVDDGLIALWMAGKVWQNPGEQSGAVITVDVL